MNPEPAAPAAMTLLKDQRPEDGQRVIARLALADGTVTYRARYREGADLFLPQWVTTDRKTGYVKRLSTQPYDAWRPDPQEPA